VRAVREDLVPSAYPTYDRRRIGVKTSGRWLRVVPTLASLSPPTGGDEVSAVDQNMARPDSVVPRRRPARRMSKPGWVTMTARSLGTAAVVARYLAFNPDTYFPEQREVYLQREFVLGVHVLCGMLALAVG